MEEKTEQLRYIKRELPIMRSVSTSIELLDADVDDVLLIHNMYGLAGIGKTYALQQLYESLAAEHNVVWLNFDLKDQPGIHSHDFSDFSIVLERIAWTAVAAELNQIPALAGRLSEKITFDEKHTVQFASMGDVLWQRTVDDNSKRLVVLLDSLDNLPYWRWLQEQVLKPLVELRQAVIVCASRAPLFWHYWELREAVQEHELTAFSYEETHELLERSHRTPLLDELYDLTGGYPLVLREFVTMADAPFGAHDSPAEGMSIQLDQLTPETNALLLQVGGTRRLQIGVMQELLPKRAEERQSTVAAKESMLVALKEIKNRGYIVSYPDRIDRSTPALRAALRDELGPESYLERCRHIAERYYERATKAPLTEDAAVIEWLFFATEPFVHNPNASQEAWKDKLRTLSERVKAVYRDMPNGGPNLARQLYLDGELLHRLADLILLETVEKELLEGLPQRPLALKRDVARAASNTLTLLGERFLGMSPNDFRSFAAALQQLRPTDPNAALDLKHFQEELIKNWPILQYRPTRSLNELIALMSGDGILEYDRDQRMYRFHPLIVRLLMLTEPKGEGRV